MEQENTIRFRHGDSKISLVCRDDNCVLDGQRDAYPDVLGPLRGNESPACQRHGYVVQVLRCLHAYPDLMLCRRQAERALQARCLRGSNAMQWIPGLRKVLRLSWRQERKVRLVVCVDPGH